MLVGAVLTPERRKDPELGQGRGPPEQLLDALVFLRRQVVLFDQRRCDRWISLEGCGTRQFLLESGFGLVESAFTLESGFGLSESVLGFTVSAGTPFGMKMAFQV